MKSLEIPDANVLAKDPDAVELVRFWIGGGKCRIALNIGVWQDGGESEVDELSVWGNVLSDITKHVANAMKQRYQMDRDETVERVRRVYLNCLANDQEHIAGT
jgi:Domain of unknown function (DUF5076)